MSHNKSKFSASVVLFNTPEHQIEHLLKCIRSSNCIDTFYIIDNSPAPQNISKCEGINIDYIWLNSNVGYGSGHNVAIKKSIASDYLFHFVLNPDISFESDALEMMLTRISKDDNIGLLMPLVTYPDGNIQYLCKLLPTPVDLFLRRFSFGPFKRVAERNADRFELRFTGYNREMNVPFLSGCFMLLSLEILKDVGLFDETFFMYGEDIDLSRRIHEKYKTLFFPGACIIHDHEKASYKNLKMLWIHLINVAKYFNKWGWVIDPARKKINNKTLRALKSFNK